MAVYKVTTTVGEFSETVLVEARLPSQAAKHATKINVSTSVVKGADIARLIKAGIPFIEAPAAQEFEETSAPALEIEAAEAEGSI